MGDISSICLPFLIYDMATESEKKTYRKGSAEIDLDNYLSNLEGNWDSWFNDSTKDWKKLAKLHNLKEEDLRTLVREAYLNFYDATKNGLLSYLDNGRFSDSRGYLDNNNIAHRVALGYINNVLGKQTGITALEPSKPAAFDGKTAWTDFLKKNVNVSDFRKLGDTRSAKFNDLIEDYLKTVKDNDDYVTGLRSTLASAMQDKTINPHDYYSFNKYGLLNLEELFGKETPTTELTEEQEIDRLIAAVLKELELLTKQKALDAAKLSLALLNWLRNRRSELDNMEIDNNQIFKFGDIDDYRNKKFTTTEIDLIRKSNPSAKLTAKEYNDLYQQALDNRIARFAQYATSRDYNNPFKYYELFNNSDEEVNSGTFDIIDTPRYYTEEYYSNPVLILDSRVKARAHALDFIDAYKNNPDHMIITKGLEGWLLVDNDFNSDIVTILSPDGTTLRKVPISKILLKSNKDIVGAYLQNALQQQKFKLGGIIKAALGTDLTTTPLRNTAEDYLKAQLVAKLEKLNNLIAESGKSPELFLALNELESIPLSTKVRLGAIGSDIISTIAAFIPGYGTAVSAGTGLLSTGLNAYADYNELDAGEATLNLATSLGMDVIGLIPGLGSGAKWAKITKNLNKYAIRPLTIAATAYLGIEEAQPFVLTVDKWKKSGYDFSALSMDDILHIASGLAVISGVTTWGKEVKTRRTHSKYGGRGTPSPAYDIVTSDGSTVRLTLERYDLLRRASSTSSNTDALTAQNTLLESWFPGKKIATPFTEFSVLGVPKTNGPKVERVLLYSDTPPILDVTADIPGLYGMLYKSVEGEVKPKKGTNAWLWSKLDNLGATPSETNARRNKVALEAQALKEAIEAQARAAEEQQKAIAAARLRRSDAAKKGAETKRKNKEKQLLSLKNSVPLPDGVPTSGEFGKPIGGRWIVFNGDNADKARDLLRLGVSFEDIVSLLKLKSGGTLNISKVRQKYKEGGSVPFIIKAQGGADSKWFTDLYNLKILKYNGLDISDINIPNSALRKGMGVNLYLGYDSNRYNLDAVYTANENYKKNKDRITSDILSYFSQLGDLSNLSDLQLVDLYNADAEKIRLFWDDKNREYTRNEDIRAHNILHKKLFKSRNTAGGDASIGNVGWDEQNANWLGTSTWARRMDRYLDEFSGLEDRIHKLNINGREVLVYKKPNGDIGIFHPRPDNKIPNTPDVTINTPNGSVTIPGVSSPDPIKAARAATKPTGETPTGTVGSGSLVPTKTPKEGLSKLWQIGMEVAPDILATGRLIGTLGTNRSIYNTMRRSIRPFLRDTYELYSPITGAFSEMQLRNQLGADTMYRADKAATSDASLNTAIMLDANRQNTELLRQGFLADDNEIKRTKAEALARVEDNIKRRSDTANFNRESLVKHKRELGLLRADYRKKNWDATNMYLSGIEADMRQKLANWKQFAQESSYSTNQLNTLKLQEEMRLAYKAWANKEIAEGRTPTMDKWPLIEEYRQKMLEQSLRQILDHYDLVAELNYYPRITFGTNHKPSGWNYKDYSQ